MVVQLRAERLVVVRLHFRPHGGNESHHPGSAVDHLGRPPGEAHYFLERFRFVFRVRLSVVHRR